MTQVPGEQLSLRETARCHEEIRAQFGGYERCHRNTGHQQFGVGCDDGCVFGDQVSVWGAPGAAARIAPWRHRRRR
jgi:hypothetical protein